MTKRGADWDENYGVRFGGGGGGCPDSEILFAFPIRPFFEIHLKSDLSQHSHSHISTGFYVVFIVRLPCKYVPSVQFGENLMRQPVDSRPVNWFNT